MDACRKCFNRSSACVLAAVLLLALGGCGDDDEESARTFTEARPADTATETAPAPPAEDDDETGTEEAPSPEDEPGGAGDEEAARTLALFTGEDGRIRPPVIRVPAYISIRVELRSADDAGYGLIFEGARIKVEGGLASVSTTIDGLRPGEAMVGRPIGASNRVRIEATAEPGP